MNVPKYIKAILSRSEFVLGEGDPGYTIRVGKRTDYCRAATLENDVSKLYWWVQGQYEKLLKAAGPLSEADMAVIQEEPVCKKHRNKSFAEKNQK